jgi:hypothetical protein
MRDFIQSLGAKLVVAAFMLGLIIIVVAVKTSVYNFYLVGTGILLILISLVFYFMAGSSGNENQERKWLAKLKSTGFKIPVDLTKCKIKSNSWIEEKDRYSNSRIAFWNQVGGDADKNLERVENNHSVVEYECEFKGRKQIFLGLASKDETTLRILLELKKETTIYVDRDDVDNYYFDLEFISPDSP